MEALEKGSISIEMADEETERRHGAIIEFICCFSLSDEHPQTLSDLSDGVALIEVLSEIAPSYFDPSTIARSLGDNWALKSSNLRKLIRNLETYYHEDLGKTADFEQRSSDVSAISKDADPEALELLFELVAAAAVTCDERGEFVSRIMSMSENGQVGMKSVLERSLSKLDDYDPDYADGDDDDKEDEESLNFGNDFMEDIEEELKSSPFNGDNYSDSGLFQGNGSSIGYEDSQENTALVQERDELQRSLADVRQELANAKSQSALTMEDNEGSERKLRALVEDLQDRLRTRQDELNEAEKELKQVRRSLDDAEEKSTKMEEQNAVLADDLDVANAKAVQLRRAEATVAAYRKKLEGAGNMSLQMQDLEDQAADYLRQIMDLENEVKAVPGMQRKITELNDIIAKLNKDKVDLDVDLKDKEVQVKKLSSDLTSAMKDKDMYKEELANTKDIQDLPEEDLAISHNMSLTSTKSVSANREKLMRLEIENKRQKDHIQKLESQVSAGGGAGGASSTEAKALKAQINRLKMEKQKLGSDKEKLEVYTKKTLAKFQEKYLVALQECKGKLKEKHDKIEALEMRNAAEKNTQKREERLLSSTIYELGLAIMQNRLKDRGDM